MNEDKKNEIKKALLQGGLVVAQRGSGKTRALAEIIMEDPDAVVIVGSDPFRIALQDMLYRLGADRDSINIRVVGKRTLQGEHYFYDKNVYVDEWYNNEYRGPFKAAVTSMPFAVKVIK